MTLLPLLLLAASARAAGCPPYRDAWEADWAFTKKAYEAACADGETMGSMALQSAQRAAVSACVEHFRPKLARGSALTEDVDAVCAQGEAGRRRLAVLTGEAVAAEAPAAPPPPKLIPGSSGMPLFAAALAAAREKREDACWSGLYYMLLSTEYASYADGRFLRTRTLIEEYQYMFKPEGDPGAQGSIIVVGDRLPDSCMDLERLAGPQAAFARAESHEMEACLDAPKVGLQTAVGVARAHGLPEAIPLRAFLVTLPRGYFTSYDCNLKMPDGTEARCPDVEGWGKGSLRLATGRPVWMVTGAGKTAVVDATTGRFRTLGPGEFKPIRLSLDARIATVCRKWE